MPVLFALPFVCGALTAVVAGIAGFLLVGHVRFAMWCRHRDLPYPRPLEALWMNLGELVSVAKVMAFNLRAPLSKRTFPSGRAVLCIHGYTQNGSNFWHIEQALHAVGRPTRTQFLGFAWPWRRIDGYRLALVEALERSDPEGVDLVAHSMGGLVLRTVLRDRADLRERIRSVVTLGSPHRGTAAARWFTWIHPTDELMYESPWVLELPTLGELLPGVPITTVGGTADVIVYPVSSTSQPGSTHRVLEGIGHAGLLVHPDAIEAVVNGVTAAGP